LAVRGKTLGVEEKKRGVGLVEIMAVERREEPLWHRLVEEGS
jgi:hypothetical protein